MFMIFFFLMFRLFFFNDTATTEIYTLSLHDALPISAIQRLGTLRPMLGVYSGFALFACNTQLTMSHPDQDRKSTRLNSSHLVISYAVFCLKKKKQIISHHNRSSTRFRCDRDIPCVTL